MKVHLKQIPPEGLHLEGEDDCLISELESEGVRCVGPMQYKIDIGVSELPWQAFTEAHQRKNTIGLRK